MPKDIWIKYYILFLLSQNANKKCVAGPPVKKFALKFQKDWPCMINFKNLQLCMGLS
jgi:hypothetical protein